MTRRLPLNETQLKALRWIADGCPDGVWTGHAHKTSCYALQDRGLADVDRRRESWSATITDDGRHYLDHGAYPELELEKVRKRAAAASPWGADRADAPGDAELAASIIQRVLAEGAVDDLGEMGRGFDARRVEGAAARSPWRPRGRTLRLHSYGGWTDRKVQAYFEDDLSIAVEPAEVPVPARVTRWHPAAAAYRAGRDRQEVTKDSVARASRIVHALALECDRRGHEMRWVEQVGQYYQDFRRALSRGQVSIAIDQFAYNVRIREIAGKGGRPRDYRDRAALPGWLSNRGHNFVPTGRLELIVGGGYAREGRRAAFRDGKRAQLEDLLPVALWELEVRALEDARTADKRQREADRKREQWRAAMESAELQLVESHRHEALAGQAAAWEEHARLERYVHAMRERLRKLDNADAADGLADWISWAERHLAATAPFAQTPHAPNDPTPTAESMQPFLGGWTFYPPELTTSLGVGDRGDDGPTEANNR